MKQRNQNWSSRLTISTNPTDPPGMQCSWVYEVRLNPSLSLCRLTDTSVESANLHVVAINFQWFLFGTQNKLEFYAIPGGFRLFYRGSAKLLSVMEKQVVFLCQKWLKSALSERNPITNWTVSENREKCDKMVIILHKHFRWNSEWTESSIRLLLCTNSRAMNRQNKRNKLVYRDNLGAVSKNQQR